MADDFMDSVWSRVKKITGQCAAVTDAEDLKASAKTAQKRIKQTLQGGKLLQKDSRVFDYLGKANDGLGSVIESLDKAGDICMDIRAISRIHDAMKVLDDENVVYDNPEAAAKAFGDLFVGFGRLCRHLPSPGKEWGQFLEQAGDFFSNWQRFVKGYTDRIMSYSNEN
jgi:hypothetical protein